MHRLTRAFAALPLVLAACKPAPPPPAATASHPVRPALPPGEGRVAVDGGEIWYKVSGGGNATPVILVHGGPGLSSFYLKSLEQLGNERAVVRYDQLGAGKSTPTTDTTLMNIPAFVAQLEALRRQLGYGRMHLIGHSWGAQVALAYYETYPQSVESLVLASPSLDIPAWNRNVARLVSTLSDSAQRAITAYERGGRANPAAYAAAANEFYTKYVWRRPVAADLDSLLATANPAIGVYMKGNGEFVVAGTLARYDATPQLRRVKVPALFLAGQFDEAGPETVRHFAELTPGARMVVIPGAAHMTTWDDPAATVAAVRSFLKRADASSAKRRQRIL